MGRKTGVLVLMLGACGPAPAARTAAESDARPSRGVAQAPPDVDDPCVRADGLPPGNAEEEVEVVADLESWQQASACRAGEADRCARYGHRFRSQAHRDDARARACFERACSGGSAEGCSALGDVLEDDPAARAAAHERGCRGGLLASCETLAQDAVRREDEDAASRFWTEVCRISPPRCVGYAAEWWRTSSDPASRARGLVLLRSACEHGQAGDCVSAGASAWARGDAPSRELARALYRIGCERGSPADCMEAGERLWRARDDAARADGRALYQTACDRGEGSACEWLQDPQDPWRGLASPNPHHRGQRVLTRLADEVGGEAPVLLESLLSRPLFAEGVEVDAFLVAVAERSPEIKPAVLARVRPHAEAECLSRADRRRVRDLSTVIERSSDPREILVAWLRTTTITCRGVPMLGALRRPAIGA